MQPKVKDALRKEAHAAFERALVRFSTKYPKAMGCLAKDREEMLAFYDFPVEHWVHIRTTNPRLNQSLLRSACGPQLRIEEYDLGDALQAVVVSAE